MMLLLNVLYCQGRTELVLMNWLVYILSLPTICQGLIHIVNIPDVKTTCSISFPMKDWFDDGMVALTMGPELSRNIGTVRFGI